ncbi:hypothetical protein D3C81_2000600 [compost metagenome]
MVQAADAAVVCGQSQHLKKLLQRERLQRRLHVPESYRLHGFEQSGIHAFLCQPAPLRREIFPSGDWTGAHAVQPLLHWQWSVQTP